MKYGCFQHIALHGHEIIAGAFVSCCGAAYTFTIDVNKPAATATTFHQAREEITGALSIPHANLLACLVIALSKITGLSFFLSVFDRLPKRVINNAKLGQIMDDPVG